MIRELLPKTRYEREALLKSFLLFFLTMELLLGAVTYLSYRNDLTELKNSLFLEMKNFSYTFEGEKFSIDVVSLKGNERFYELFESADGLSILVPIPFSEEEALKIYYPWDRFGLDVNAVRVKNLLLFSLSSMFALALSAVFSLYSLAPLRRALTIIEEVTKDIIHDINTPIMSLFVNLKILGKRYDDEEIERALLALKQLKNLRDNLKPMLKETKLKLHEVDVSGVVEEELRDLSLLYPDVRIEKNIGKVRLKAQEDAVRRIVSNILSNAFKHSYPKEWVRVELDDKRLIVENPSKPVRNPSRLFERYYRESQRGLGLGLSIVKKLCEELGWDVKAFYKEGKFRVEVTFG